MTSPSAMASASLAVAALALVAVQGGCGDDGSTGRDDAGASDGAAARDAGPSPEDGGADGATRLDGGAGVDAGPGGACEPAAAEHTGEGTYYAADGSGNCSFPPSPGDLLVGAMNQTDYMTSAACGACAHVVGPDGEVTVRIVDRCPECAPGDVDLSPQAFERIAPLSAGRIPIRWRYVPCEVTGPVVYHFKEESNQWWSAVQVRNHRHAIARFEYRADDGSFRDVARLEYNYFVEASGMGPGPYTFRITDVWGHVLVDEGIGFVEAGSVEGAAQLPACE